MIHTAQFDRQELLGDEAAAIYAQRLELLWQQAITRANEGDNRAADLCVTLLDRFARFHGLRH